MLKFTNVPASEAGHKTIQCRVNPKCIIAEGAWGTVFWATPARAQLLANVGAVEIISGTPAPSETPRVGPSETKPAGPAEVKQGPEPEVRVDEDPNVSSAAAPDGQSTDSAASVDAAPAEPSSASEAGPASPSSIAPRSRRGGRRAGLPAKSSS